MLTQTKSPDTAGGGPGLENHLKPHDSTSADAVKLVPPVAALANQILAAHHAARSAAESAIAHAVRAGELLFQAKAQLPHGSFGQWLRENVKFSDRTARGYMQLAGLDEAKRQRVADLSLRQALAEIAELRPQAPADEFRHLRDEILRSDDLDEIYPKMITLHREATAIIDDTTDLDLLAELSRDDLEQHVTALKFEAQRKYSALAGVESPEQPPWTPAVNMASELFTCPWEDHRLVVISPSRKHPGYYYVETHDIQNEIVDGMRRPIKQAALGEWLEHMFKHIGPPRDMRWLRCAPGMGPDYA